MRQCLLFDNALLFFLIAALIVTGGSGCGQRNPGGGARNAAAEGQDRFFDSGSVKLSEEEAKETERVLRAVGSQYAADLDPRAVAPMMRGFAELVVADEALKNNRTPVMALYSNENDAGRPLAGEITALGQRMPNVSLYQIKDANHGNARSKPQFAESLAEFLAKHAPPGRETEKK